MAFELFTERNLLKDILPKKAKDIAKQYKLKVNEIEFIRKKNPLKAEDIKIEDGERAAIRYINTADLDRDNEIVLPSGGQVNDFKKSPSVLYGHNYQGLPIGKDIWIKLVQGKGWLAKTIYAKHQLAVDVYNLVKEKFLNTSSIGFIPLEWVKPEDKSWGKWKEVVKSEYGISEKLVNGAKRIYTKWLLLEHSDVPVPSNASALNIAVGKGLEIKSQELIDDLELEIIDDEEELKEKDVNEIIDEIDKETETEKEKQKEIEEMFSDEFVTKPEETEDYIHLPAKGEEGKHEGHKIRTIDIDVKQGIKAKYCVDCKKIISFMLDKAKGWTMAKAKKWMADHGKNISGYYEGIEESTLDNLKYESLTIEDCENEIKDIAEEGKQKSFQKEEPGKGISLKEATKEEKLKEIGLFDINELYEIVKENKKLIKALEEITAELKAGAVLNRKNKDNLRKIKALADEVLESAETAEPAEEGKEVDGLEIEEDKKLDIVEKEVAELAEEKEETFDISADEIKGMVKQALNEQTDKIAKNLRQDVNDNFRRIAGKVI